MDTLVRGINDSSDIRVVTATTTDLVREACRRHELRAGAAVVLGRALTAGCLLATLTKNENERVRIRLRGSGPLGNAMVDATSDGSARGCFEGENTRGTADNAGPRPAVRGLVGDSGQIVVTRDVGLDKEYQGIVEISDGEVDTDLQRYLTESEQLPSILQCETVLDARGDVLRSAGLLCQTFPNADPSVLQPIRDVVGNGGLFDLLRQDRTSEDVMGFALAGGAFSTLETRPLHFSCHCGRERALSVLSTLGADDIIELANEQGETEVRCSYCGDAYVVSREDLLALAEHVRQERS